MAITIAMILYKYSCIWAPSVQMCVRFLAVVYLVLPFICMNNPMLASCIVYLCLQLSLCHSS